MGILTYGILLGFMYYQAKRIWRTRWDYFTQLWNWIDVLHYAFMVGSLVLAIQYLVAYHASLDSSTQSPKDFGEALVAVESNYEFRKLFGISFFIMTLKLLKYVNVIPGLGLSIDVLQEAGTEIAATMFAIMSLIIGIAAFIYLYLGAEVYILSSFGKTLLQIFKVLNGYHHELYNALDNVGSNTLPATMIVIFEMLMRFVVLAVLISVVSAAYDKVHHDFTAAGIPTWTLQRMYKLTVKSIKKHREKRNKDPETNGSWSSYITKRVKQWWNDEEDEEDDETAGQVQVGSERHQNMHMTGLTTLQSSNTNAAVAYNRARKQMVTTATEELESVQDTIKCASKAVRIASSHFDKVALLQAWIDKLTIKQQKVDKGILGMFSEVLRISGPPAEPAGHAKEQNQYH